VEPLEVEKEIMELKEDVARLDVEVGNLNGWQKSQNGALLRVDQKVDNLQKWILGVLAGVVASIFINLLKP
jgi:hypothetical protein